MKTIFACLLVMLFIGNAYAIDYVNEDSTAKITLTFTDENGIAVTPSSGTYRIDDIGSGTEIKDDTDFTPVGSTYSIIITDTENRILDQADSVERRRFTVTFIYGGTKKGTGDYKYEVRNLPGIE